MPSLILTNPITMPIISEVTLAYRAPKSIDKLPTITSPADAAAYLRSIWDDDQLDFREQFIIILLDNQKRVLGWNLVSSGGATATIVDVASIFQAAMLGNSKSLILSSKIMMNCSLKSSWSSSQMDRR